MEARARGQKYEEGLVPDPTAFFHWCAKARIKGLKDKDKELKYPYLEKAISSFFWII